VKVFYWFAQDPDFPEKELSQKSQKDAQKAPHRKINKYLSLGHF
jgi:hypothetical protein